MQFHHDRKYIFNSSERVFSAGKSCYFLAQESRFTFPRRKVASLTCAELSFYFQVTLMDAALDFFTEEINS